MIRVGVLGASGRMGQAIIAELKNHPKMILGGAYARRLVNLEDVTIHLDHATVFEASDVVLDFTSPYTVETHLQQAHKYKKPIIVGITGLSDSHKKLLVETAKYAPVVYAENTSMGATILTFLTQHLAKWLDESFDIEILDIHHRNKVDAPSGTAIALGRAAARGRGLDSDVHLALERSGLRRPQSIGFAVQRGGNGAGEHTVSFMGDNETFNLTTRTYSRSVYAKGALHAAAWAVTQSPGLYTMVDVLGVHGLFRS